MSSSTLNDVPLLSPSGAKPLQRGSDDSDGLVIVPVQIAPFEFKEQVSR